MSLAEIKTTDIKMLTDEIARLRAALRAIAEYSPGKSTEALLLRGYARIALEDGSSGGW